MTDDGSSSYALHRLRLASARQAKYLALHTRLEDRIDTLRNKGWRTRVRREQVRVGRRLDRANADYQRWTVEFRRRQSAERERAARQAAPRPAERLPAPPMPDELEDYASEWEIGLDYEATGGDASNVNVNIRLRRTDGRDFSMTEAQAALGILRDNINRGLSDPSPSGYEIAGIDWQQPERSSRGWRHGDWDQLGGLYNPLYVASDQLYLRLGSVDD